MGENEQLMRVLRIHFHGSKLCGPNKRIQNITDDEILTNLDKGLIFQCQVMCDILSSL